MEWYKDNYCGIRQDVCYFRAPQFNFNNIPRPHERVLSNYPPMPSIPKQEEFINLIDTDALLFSEPINTQILSILAILLFVSFHTFSSVKSKMVPRMLSLSWIFVGMKIYLEPAFSLGIFDNKLNFLYGTISMFLGLLLFMNYLDFYKKILAPQPILSRIKTAFNFLFLNYNYGYFSFTAGQIHYFSAETFGNGNLNSCIFVAFMLLNTMPLLVNTVFNENIFNLSLEMFPSIYGLINLTLLLLTFSSTSQMGKCNSSLEILCYIFLFCKFVQDISNRNLKSSHIFFISLTIINVILYYCSAMAIPNQFNYTSERLATALSFQGFLLREHTITEAGIEGYLGINMFWDSYSNSYANEVYELHDDKFTSSGDFIKTKLNPTIRSPRVIYPKYKY